MKHFLIKTLPIIFLAVNTQLVCSCNVSSQEKDEIISLMVKNKYAYKVIAIPDALSRLVNFNETLICFGLTNEVENDKVNYVLFANDKTNECIYFKYPKLIYEKYLSSTTDSNGQLFHIYKSSSIAKITHNFSYHYQIYNETPTKNWISLDFKITFSEKNNKGTITINGGYGALENGKKTKTNLVNSTITLEKYKKD